MHKVKLPLLAFAAMLPLLYLLAPASRQLTKTLTVRPGDTVSYLAFRYYGFYNDSLRSVLTAANPQIPDLDLIKAGDTLHFPAREAEQTELETVRSEPAHAVLTFLEGPVSFRRPRDSAQFVPARPNLLLGPGDELKTGSNARAELVLDNRSVLRLDANSHLRIVSLERASSDGQPARIYKGKLGLSLGSLWTRITKILGQRPRFDLQFPTAIAGVQGTIYRSTVAADSTTTVRVYDGAVEVRGKVQPASTGAPRAIGPPREVPGPTEVTMETWVKMVRAYQEIVISNRGKPSQPRPFRDQGAEQDWVKWNQERDQDLDAEI